MSRQELILVPSERMDNNKKTNRNEHNLIRMAKVTRDNVGLEGAVELHTAEGGSSESEPVLLDIFHAFTSDIKGLKRQGVSPEEIVRVGFVTTNTFRRIMGQERDRNNVWITDGIEGILIGADPEFLLFDQDGMVVHAANRLNHTGIIGHDGAMAEIRPYPASIPEVLSSNIRSALSDDKCVSEIKNCKWMASGFFRDSTRSYPVGGHIHIGNPARIARMVSDRRRRFFDVLNKIVDEKLSLPMTRIDGSDVCKARRVEGAFGQRFGFFGGLRVCDGRLEHRTLSGMWLMHPLLATAVFGVAKAIIDEVYRHVAHNNFEIDYMCQSGSLEGANLYHTDFDDWGNIPLARDLDCRTSSKRMMMLLNQAPVEEVNKGFLKNWHDGMRGLSTYREYSDYIDGLYEILKNDTKVFHDYINSKSMQETWLEGAEFIE